MSFGFSGTHVWTFSGSGTSTSVLWLGDSRHLPWQRTQWYTTQFWARVPVPQLLLIALWMGPILPWVISILALCFPLPHLTPREANSRCPRGGISLLHSPSCIRLCSGGCLEITPGTTVGGARLGIGTSPAGLEMQTETLSLYNHSCHKCFFVWQGYTL